jgi:sec-independent protein translocase protein TatA
MPFGLQPIHLIVVAIVALLIFGPARLPEIGRGVGKAITEFRRGAKEMGGSFMEEVNQPIETPSQPPAPAQAAPFVPLVKPTSAADQPAESIQCMHCGKVNPMSAVFCNACGQKIAE